jgi:hypothetical protein
MLVHRFNIQFETLVALHEHENHKSSSPRLIWLTGICFGSWMPGTDMRCELLVALLLEVHLHLVN